MKNPYKSRILVGMSFLMVGILLGEDLKEEVTELAAFPVYGENYAFGAQKIITLTEGQVSRLQAVDLEDLFSGTPSIQVGGGLAAAEKIYVRGIEDKLLNVSINGVPQAGYLSHHQGQFTMEPELIKRVQVEPGPGGALQGAGALAGSIRFENKGAEDFLKPDERGGWFQKVTGSENGSGLKVTTAPYVRLGEGESFLVAHTWYDVEDYADGNGNKIDYTGHKQERLFLNGASRLSPENHDLSVSYEWIEDSGVFRHRPNFYGYFPHPIAPNNPIEMTFGRETLIGTYDQVVGGGEGISAMAFITENSVDRVGQYEMSYRSWGGDARYVMTLADERHQITVGMDYRGDRLEFIGKGSVTGFAGTLNYQTIPDETLEVIGLYVQDEWAATDRLEVAFGTRMDRYRYEDKDGQEYNEEGISPSVGVGYAVTDQLEVNLSLGWAFRGPTIIDAITANEGTIFNDPRLDPEIATNGEFGITYTVGPFSLTSTLYKQKIRDVIVNGNPNRSNGGDLEVKGYDFTLLYYQEELTISLSMSDSNPELNGSALNDNSLGLGTSYGRQWVGRVEYQFDQLPINLGWTVQLAEELTDVPVGIPQKPGYVVHGFDMEWEPIERITVTLSVRNVFNKYYIDQTTSGYNSQINRIAGLPAPGRDIRLSFGYQF